MIRPLKHNHAVITAAFSPDGRWLVTSSYDDLVRIWDIATEELVVPPLPHRGLVEDAVFSPNGRRLATACNDGLVRIWELAVGEPFLSARSVTGIVTRLLPGSIPEHLLVTRSAGSQLWDTTANEPVGPVLSHSKPVQEVAFTRDDARVGILADSGVQVWDTRNAVPLTPLLTQSNGVKSLWFSWNGDRIFAWSGTTLSAWNASNGLPILHERSFTAHRKTKPVYSNIPTLFPAPLKNRDLIIAIQDNAAQVWDLATGEPVGPLLKQEKTIESASMSPDGMRVVTSCREGSSIWDLSSPQAVAIPRRLKVWALHSEFDAEGKRIVTGSMDTTARVWDALTGKPLTPPLQHSYHVYFASFSPDGKRVLTSSTDGTARVWDSLTGEPITPPLKHGSLQGNVPIHWNGRWVSAGRGSDKVWLIGQDERPLADWQRTAELLDNNRIGSAGDLTRSYRSTVLSNWLTLKAKYPGDFVSTREQAIYFHRRQASECENANQWAAAQFHLEQLIKEFPDDPKLQSRRETARRGLLQLDDDAPLPTRPQIFPARNQRTPPELIDLSPHYNFAITNRLPGQKAPFGLELLPQGIQSFNGVEFDVRGIVLLSSSTLEALPKASYRTQARITINRKCQRLHFLHSCWDTPVKVHEGTRVGTYKIHYANDEVWDVPIVYGKDLRTLPFTSQLNDTPNADVAWTSLGLTTGGNARLYHKRLENLRPSVEIESIELISAMSDAAPLLFAITVE
jgi:WD40 repeat protein